MDTLTPQARSERMSLVRGRDTKPELLVRRLTHGLGYRFRLHVARLPGRPDLVFPSRGKVIFIHGCFWHRHKGCALARMPKSRLEFWAPKLNANKVRDLRNRKRLSALGWRSLLIWECEIKDTKRLERRIKAFLDKRE